VSYLLWQLFWCLLGTAVLFFVLGWLLRAWFKRDAAPHNVITDSERSSWQSSLEGVKARLEAETGRRLAAEKALEDSHGQQAKISSLLDQHSTEIQALTRELADNDKALGLRETSLKQLQARLAELEAEQVSSQDIAEERDALKTEVASLRAELSETAPKLVAAVAAGAEVIALRARVADLEPKFRAASEENGKLRSQVSEVAPKLAMAAAAGAEVIALKTQLAQLEPQVADLQQEIQASAAELSQCRGRVAELEQQATPKVERDDLKKIYGIGPVLEKRLNGLGVYFFREIAMWTKEDVLRYEEHLKEFPDRIERDNWVEGAREQHFKKYGETLLKEKSAGA